MSYYTDTTPLTPERERELARRIIAARDARDALNVGGVTPERRVVLRELVLAGEEAREELLERNHGLVHMIARRYFSEHPSLDYEDVAQEGQQGLLRATGSFDPERGYRFSTYAGPWITRFILEAIERSGTIRVPGEAQRDTREALRVQEDLGSNDPREMLERLGVGWSEERVARALAPPRVMSLSTAVGAAGSERVLADVLALASAVDPVDHAAEQQLRTRVEGALAGLSERSRFVVRARFGIGHAVLTRQQIAEVLGVTVERVRQLENRALEALSEPLAAYAPPAHKENPHAVQ